MKLYFFPGACSLAINISLREAGVSFELIEVDYHTRMLEDGSDYHTINPKGSVPALRLDDGTCLTEIIALLCYLNMEYENAGLFGSPESQQTVLEWLSFLATEVHKSFSPLFRSDTPTCFRTPGREHLEKRLTIVEYRLSEQPYLVEVVPTAADFYLYTLCRWLPDVGIRPKKFPKITKHSVALERLLSVQHALASEKLGRTSAASRW